MNARALALILLLPLDLVLTARDSMGQTPATAPTRRLTDRLTPCRVPDLEEKVLCGRHEVFENRATGAGRKIGLNIVVLPAKSPQAAPDPLVFLAGGGVAPATGYARFLAGAFADLRKERDILLIDQRGTGGSNPLRCDLPTEAANPEYRDEGRFLENVRNCRKELKRKADPRYYTTPVAMDDLDEVRGWLGYPRLNLYGASYGTKAAMVYVRQHLDTVRSVVLQGVMPIDAPVWLEVPRSSQQALEHVFAVCAVQKDCHDAFPDLAQEFNALLDRLAGKPVRFKVSRPEGGQEVEVPIDAEILRVFVLRMLYSADRIHDLPLLIHLAHAGDYQPLARRLAIPPDSGIPKGIYFTIVCSDEIPQFDPAALPAAAAGSFLGDFRIGRELLACGKWTRGWLPEGYRTPVGSNVPALVMNGALDHITPPRYGERVAKSLTNARSLVLPNRGHNDVDPCVTGIIQSFVAAGGPNGLDTSCLAKTPDLSFATRADELMD